MVTTRSSNNGGQAPRLGPKKKADAPVLLTKYSVKDFKDACLGKRTVPIDLPIPVNGDPS